MLSWLVVLGLVADAGTFLLLPPGAEANPIVLALPPLVALGLRALATGLLVLSARYLSPTRRELLLGLGVAAGFLGAGSNLSVLL